MLNILMPMAGEGRRFREAGYGEPKPMIHVGGYPMFMRVVDNLNPSPPFRFVFVVRKDSHIKIYGRSDCDFEILVVALDEPTRGAALSCLAAREFIDTDDELIIANCDQLVEGANCGVTAMVRGGDCDGAVLTMKADGSTKWSYAYTVGYRVDHIAEKNPISDRATVGVYRWRRGKDFVASALRMIDANDCVNGEFYVAPAYNYFKGLVVERRVEDFGGTFHGLGTPEDLEKYLKGGK